MHCPFPFGTIIQPMGFEMIFICYFSCTDFSHMIKFLEAEEQIINSKAEEI